MTYFFTSDSHFCHTNIVKGTSKWTDTSSCRPFTTVEEHDNTLLENINSVVGFDDVLIHAGDWSFGHISNVKKFRDLIRCRNVWLIKGNHDKKLWRTERHLFQLTDKLLDDFYIGSQQVVVCHYAFQVWEDNHRGSICLCGHSHNNLDHTDDGKILDVCPEGHGYKPWSFDEIMEYMNSKPIVARDHHK